MKILTNGFFSKLRTEPPVAAAFITIAVFSLPVLFGIVLRGYILLPEGYTYVKIVEPLYAFIAILIDLVLVYLFSRAPIIKLGFHSILTPDYVRKALIIIYIIITWISFFIINAKLNFFNSLLEDPVLTMLKVGTDIVEENLLRSFFFGMSGCLAFALTRKDDSFFLRAAGLFTAIAIVIFYFFVGRREISLMTLCFLLLVKRDKIGKVYLIGVGVALAAILVTVLSLRVSTQDSSNDQLYATDSEELSTVAYSAYVIQAVTPDLPGSVTGVSPLRLVMYPYTISATFIKAQTGYSDTASPVLGIGGVTYMYGFIIPVIMVIMLGSLFRSVNHEFKLNKSPVLKLLLIFIVFKTFNLFRNGEFPLVMLDVVKFFMFSAPLLYLKFKAPKNPSVYEQQ